MEIEKPKKSGITPELVFSRFAEFSWHRIGITLACVCFLMMGLHIPLPGIRMDYLYSYPSSQSNATAQLWYLGISPWLSVAAVFELIGILFPKIARSQSYSKGHVNPFSYWVIICAFALASLQTYLIVTQLELGGFLNQQSPNSARIATTFSIAGFFAVTIFVARMINEHGTGYGFWIIVALPTLFTSPDIISFFWNSTKFSDTSFTQYLLILGGFILATICIICVISSWLEKVDLSPVATLSWPIIIFFELRMLPFTFFAYFPAFEETMRIIANVIFSRELNYLLLSLIAPVLLWLIIRKKLPYRLIGLALLSLLIIIWAPSILGLILPTLTFKFYDFVSIDNYIVLVATFYLIAVNRGKPANFHLE